MNSYFRGKDLLLLQEYFDLKVKLSEWQKAKIFQERILHNSDEANIKIKEIEKNIVEIISMFNLTQLRQIIFMGLDIPYNELVVEGVIR